MHRILAFSLSAALASGCGYSHINRDNSQRPQTSTGGAARVIMPGESMPAERPAQDSEMTMLGGSSGESDVSERTRDVPLGPLAVLFGYPFWIFGKSNAQEADQAKADRERQSAAQPAPARSASDNAERTRLDAENARLREELAGRPGQPATARAAAVQPARAAQPQASGDTSLQGELAALERTLAARDRRSSAPALSATPQGGLAHAQAAADSGLAREVIDQDGDGRADRIAHYDEQHRLVRAEEDTDRNGSLESVLVYQDGQLARQSSDTDGNGAPDRWTYFRGGAPVRLETDRDGDGFRDLVSVYADGQLLREEEDRNRDGQPDRITLYSGGERVEEREDIDYDGVLDVHSIFENGRLARRELRSEQLLERWQDRP